MTASEETYATSVPSDDNRTSRSTNGASSSGLGDSSVVESIQTSMSSDEKTFAENAKLRAERGIGFEEIVFHIERGDLLGILDHPNPDRCASERIFVVRRQDYVYLVPFPPSPARSTRGLRRGHAVALRAEADVEDEHTVFLKTIIPSRKATKEYLHKYATGRLKEI